MEFQKFLIDNITSLSIKIDSVHKEINGVKKLVEKESRENEIEHKQFINDIKNVVNNNLDKDAQCLKHNQYFIDQLVKQEEILKKDIDSVRNRNFFAYAWEWLKKDIKYILLVGTLFNLDKVIQSVKYIIELIAQ